MTKKEAILTSKILEEASDLFAGRMCNDVDDSFYDGWTLEERRIFIKEYHEWNGDPEEYDENFLHLPDFAIMSFLAYKIKTNCLSHERHPALFRTRYSNHFDSF